MPGLTCGSHSRYTAGCEACQARSRRYNKTRKAAIAAGTWQPPVPAARVRAHLARLVRQRMTIREIAAAAGLAEGTLYDIHGGRGRTTVVGAIAAKVLAVKPSRRPEDTPPRGNRGMVKALATRRRVQALAWMGHSTESQAVAAGVAASVLRKITTRPDVPSYSEWVHPETEQRIAALYDRWWQTRGPSERSSDLAAKNEWHGPLAWDDDTIGDPKAKPGQAPRCTPRSARSDASVRGALAGLLPASDLTTAERIEVVTALVARGWADERIGEWLRWGDTPEQWRANACKCRRDHHIAAAPRRLREMAIEDGYQRARYLAHTAA